MTKKEKEGLESIRKRIKDGQLVIVPTDKSGRFSVMDLDTYMQAGLKHTSKDEKVSIHQIRENQSELNGHVSMILKIYRVGSSWGHEGRARSTMINQSEMISNMYCLYKDHKGWHWGLGTDPPSRPIASGNTGQNVHMSELTSELIESVVTAYKGGVEIISTEDMLAKWDDLNRANANWTPGSWWDGFEDDGLVTCGKCLGDDKIPDLCNCQDCQLDGEREPGEERHARAPGCTQDVNTEQETVPDGWKPRNRIEDFVKKKKSGEIPGQK